MSEVKAISLTDEALEVWKKKFKGKQDFSAWIQLRLLEEQQKDDSPDYLRSAIIRISQEIEKLNLDRAILQKRLDLKMQEENAKSERVLAEEEKETKKNNKELTITINKICLRLQYNLKLKLHMDRIKELALDYLHIEDEQRPDLIEFLKSKLEVKNE